jgi:hypothetical protein
MRMPPAAEKLLRRLCSVELAFRPASKPFIHDPSRLQPAAYAPLFGFSQAVAVVPNQTKQSSGFIAGGTHGRSGQRWEEAATSQGLKPALLLLYGTTKVVP